MFSKIQLLWGYRPYPYGPLRTLDIKFLIQRPYYFPKYEFTIKNLQNASEATGKSWYIHK